jgi:hypothetical protein
MKFVSDKFRTYVFFVFISQQSACTFYGQLAGIVAYSSHLSLPSCPLPNEQSAISEK